MTDFETADNPRPEEHVEDIPLRFARMDKLRAAEQTLRDIELLTRVLVKVKDRFSSLGTTKDAEVRLFINSSGTDMVLRLLYASKEAANPKDPQTNRKAAGPKQTGHGEVGEWIDLGVKAVERKNKERPETATAESNQPWQVEPAVELIWDSTLDNVLRILQTGKLVKDFS